MKPSGTASSASVRRANRGGASPVAPTDAGRSTGRRAVDSAPSSTAPSPSQTRIRIPQTVPKRVSSTSPMIWLSSADQNETPAAVAPCSTMPAMPLSTPASTARSRAVRAPAAKRSEASRHWALPPATSASDGSQIAIRKKIVPTAIAIAAYCVPRATPNATWVTSPTLPCCGEQLRDGRARWWSPSRRRTPGHRTPGGCRPRSRGRWRCSCPSRRPGFSFAASSAPLAAGMEDLAGVDARARAVEHADRAEAALDRLAEAEHDLVRVAASRSRPTAVPCSGARHGPCAPAGSASSDRTAASKAARRCLTMPPPRASGLRARPAGPRAGVAAASSARAADQQGNGAQSDEQRGERCPTTMPAPTRACRPPSPAVRRPSSARPSRRSSCAGPRP